MRGQKDYIKMRAETTKEREKSWEEESFAQGLRLYAEAMVDYLEKNGNVATRGKLGKLFDDTTMQKFPRTLTGRNLYETITGIKKEDIGYRENEK